jgi:hypothetical protein
MTEQPSVTEVFNPHQNKTLDGHVVTEGMKVWDYNLRVSVVRTDTYWRRCTDNPDAPYAGCEGDHWFDCSGGYFNASRMWVRHPSTGQSAADAEPGVQG